MPSRLTQPYRPYPRHPLRPAGAIAETLPRLSTFTSQTALTSQRASFYAVYLYANEIVSSISFYSGTVAAATVSNIWFTLADKNANKLAISADDAATGWAALTLKTLAMTTPYTIPADDYYYIGVMVNATTVPALLGVSGSSPINTLAPVLMARDDAHITLTNPASAPAAYTFSTTQTSLVYGYVS